MKAKTCSKCKITQDVDQFYRKPSAKDGLSSHCISCRYIYSKDWLAKNADKSKKIKAKSRKKATQIRKLNVLKAYSNGKVVCSCCGERQILFLSIDHKNNDGNIHRKLHGEGQVLYKWLEKNNYPKNLGLHVLCFNCNLGRHINGGVCPHEK